MNPTTDASDSQGNAQRKKPTLALVIATSLGLGYLPKAPGTWGSLMGVALGWAAIVWSQPVPITGSGPYDIGPHISSWWFSFASLLFLIVVAVSIVGVWAAGVTADYIGRKDPQIVVVDEVAGQLIAYFGLATPGAHPLNWQYLAAGFILFRVFDIWKPPPARQAESFEGGWGIMADDWVAGIYAALVLGGLRYLGQVQHWPGI